MDHPENDIKNSENNIQDIILGILHTHVLKDHSITGHAVFDSIAYGFPANTFIRFMCAFQIGFLFQIP